MPLRNQINREPIGLLSLFRAKVGGQAPQTIRDDVQPTVDVTAYLSAGTIKAAVAEASGNPPTNLSITVPAGQAWMIHNITGTLSPDAVITGGESASAWLQINGLVDKDGATTDVTIGSMAQGGTGQTDARSNSYSYVPGSTFVLPGDVSIQVQLHLDDTSAAFTFKLAVIYSELIV